MHLIRDADLQPFNAFGVEARCQAMARVQHFYEVEDLAESEEFASLPILVMGGGTNVLFRHEFPGLVLRIENQGIRIIEEADDAVYVRVAAGENWHGLVDWSTRRGLWGIENLALIPGCCGAAPIQNIGAYGVELSDCLDSVTAWDRTGNQWVTLDAESCQLGYRTSRFRDEEPDRFVITEIVLRLSSRGEPRTDYPGIRDELAALDTQTPGPVEMAAAVESIRRRKLPDPLELGNAGSFFKNPFVDSDTAEALLTQYPGLVAFDHGDGQVKISAGWLIDQCGWKGHRDGDAGVYPHHALVLVNHGEASGPEIWGLAQRIQESVHERFGLNLEPEPTII